MTEFNLTAYILVGTGEILGAFGSGDASIKAHVMTRAAPLIAESPDPAAIEQRIGDGLDQILVSARIDRYTYNVALATEMLFHAYGQDPGPDNTAIILGFTEDCLPPLRALEMPALHHAVDVLAWGREVALPVPIDRWDDVTGQYYFDSAAIRTARAELRRIAPYRASLSTLETAQPEVFKDCDSDDLEHMLAFFDRMLGRADAQGAEIAVFRHGGL